MTQTVADYLFDRLRQWDVDTVFAYPGDGINAILAAFGEAEDNPTFVQSRHEGRRRDAGRGCTGQWSPVS